MDPYLITIGSLLDSEGPEAVPGVPPASAGHFKPLECIAACTSCTQSQHMITNDSKCTNFGFAFANAGAICYAGLALYHFSLQNPIQNSQFGHFSDLQLSHWKHVSKMMCNQQDVIQN